MRDLLIFECGMADAKVQSKSTKIELVYSNLGLCISCVFGQRGWVAWWGSVVGQYIDCCWPGPLPMREC